jgi:hypothetical protein
MEPFVATSYAPGNLDGVPWTGETDPFGMLYAFPEWSRSASNKRYSPFLWRRTAVYGTLRVAWTLDIREDTRILSSASDTGLILGTQHHWWLTEGARGWKIQVGKSSVTPTYHRDYLRDSTDVVRVADRIIRNVENMADVVHKGRSPRIRKGVLHPDDVVGGDLGGLWSPAYTP